MLNEEARAYLLQQPAGRPFWERDIEDLRQQMRDECREGGGAPEPVAQVEAVDAGGVPARLYRPRRDERAVFVWFHGGAWMLGDLDCHDNLARAIANRAGCAVLSVDYRLAPDHRFPAAIDDAWTATRYAVARFVQVAVGGDSAGGNLAAAVALRCRDRGTRLDHQILVYPVLDTMVDSPFYERFRDRYRHFLADNRIAEGGDFGAESQEGIRRVCEHYVPVAADRLLPDASPLRAASLAGVAPATVVAAEHDVLRGDSEAYARRLRDAGVPVELTVYPGQVHGFFHLLGAMADARRATRQVADALRHGFAAGDLAGAN